MKFLILREWGAPNYNSGIRLILTLPKVEYRLYLWTKRTDTDICRYPFEFQRRYPWKDTEVWPERGKSVPTNNTK